MLIIGCDYHPSVQQIAFVDLETGETGERQLLHKDGEAERFYRDLKLRGVSVRVGIEATGHARWFERLVEIAKSRHSPVEIGRFGAHMVVSLVNDGPVTFRLMA